MAVQLFTNNAASTLASNITSGATSLTVQAGDGALFPNPTGGDWFIVSLETPAASAREIVKCTARSTDVLTIVRAQEGTTAQPFDSGDKVELRLTKGTLEGVLQKAGGQMSGNITMAGTETVDGRDLSVDGTKLDGIESNAAADQTGAEIKTAYEGEADTNEFSDAEQTKLAGIATGAEINPDVVPQAEAEAGTATTERIWTAERTRQAIEALAPGVSDDFIHIRDEKAQNTPGGTFTSGAWRPRDLNTEVADTGNNASVASNQITLEAGTYRAVIRAPAMKGESSQARLYNITDSAVILIGSVAESATTVQVDSWILGRFTLAAQKVLEVQHRNEVTRSTDGFGEQANFTTEVYTEVMLWKEQ